MRFLIFNGAVVLALVYLVFGPEKDQSRWSDTIKTVDPVLRTSRAEAPSAPILAPPVTTEIPQNPVKIDSAEPEPELSHGLPEVRVDTNNVVRHTASNLTTARDTSKPVSHSHSAPDQTPVPLNSPAPMVTPRAAMNEPVAPAPIAQPTAPVIITEAPIIDNIPENTLPTRPDFTASRSEFISPDILSDDAVLPDQQDDTLAITINPDTPMMDARTRRKELAHMIKSLESFME